MHRPLRKPFPRNPYNVTNVMDVWECDLVDFHVYARYNDNYRYVLSVIDVFWKYLHLVPVKRKSGPSFTSAIRSILTDMKRRPLWLRKDKGKEFVNKHFQDMLLEEGIEFQVCKYPHVKCAVVERAHRNIPNVSTDISRTRIRTGRSTLCPNLSRPITIRSTQRLTWRPHE
jgi:hypothetical protein